MVIPALIVAAVAIAADPGAPTSISEARAASTRVWLQPVGTAFFAANKDAYLAAGATRSINDTWSISVELTYAWVHHDGASDTPGVVSRGVIASVSPLFPLVRWGEGRDFFVSPKILAWVFRTSNARAGGYPGPIAPAETTVEVGIGADLGLEWTFAPLYLCAALGPSLLYSFAKNTGLAPFDNINFPGQVAGSTGLRWGFNLNLLRIGAAF